MSSTPDEPLVPGSLEAQVLALLSLHTWEATYLGHGASCFCGAEGIANHERHVAQAFIDSGLLSGAPVRHEYGVRFNKGMSAEFGSGTVVELPSLGAAIKSVTYDPDHRDVMVRSSLTDEWNAVPRAKWAS